MRHKILVIDDDPSREEHYRKLAQSSSGSINYELELVFVRSKAEVPVAMQTQRFSLALLDVMLGLWDTHLDDIVSMIPDSLPIALVSSSWDTTNADEVTRALRKEKCRTFLQFNEFTSLAGLERARLQINKAIAENVGLDQTLDLGEDDAINILHISDCQFGGFTTDVVRLEAHRIAEQIQDKCGGSAPHFVAITGDMVEHGLPEEFDAAYDWLTDFLSMFRINMPSPRILIVPGNHDLCYAIALGSRLKFLKPEPGEEKEKVKAALDESVFTPSLMKYAIRPFQDFVQRVSGANFIRHESDSPEQAAWVEASFRHLGVVFYGLSTVRTSASHWPERYMSPNALAEVLQRLKSVRDENLVFIGLTHHCPVSAHEDRSITNPANFLQFANSPITRTSIALHGHVHQSEISSQSMDRSHILIRSCASTLTKAGADRPPDTLRGGNLLSLKRSGGTVTAIEATSFEWAGERLRFDEPHIFRRVDGNFKQS